MTVSESDKLGYRRCVGIMVLNGDGHVFVGRRYPPKPEAWQMPQGTFELVCCANQTLGQWAAGWRKGKAQSLGSSVKVSRAEKEIPRLEKSLV